MNKICECGKRFETKEYRIKAGRGKYCSRKCMYKYRKRPSGLKYVLKKENPTSFKKGHKTWCTGIERHDLRKKNAGYDAIHDWIERWGGEKKYCENCQGNKNLEWSNKSHKYNRDKNDWQVLCKKCHNKYDYKKFGLRKAFFE